MRNATDYYNLLNDTLRDGYHQIKKIYNKIPEAKKNNRYINIRTGYLMNKRDFRNNNYRFNPRIKYPLCYNMQYCGCADFSVIDKILWKYSNWLDIYSQTCDINEIKKLVEKEINYAKKEYVEQNKNGENDFILFDRNNNTDTQKESESENESENSNDEISDNKSLGSFIVSDNEIEEKENEEEYEIVSEENYNNNIDNNNYEENESYENSDDDYISDNDNYLNDNTLYSSGKKKKLLKKKRCRKKSFSDLSNDSKQETLNDLPKKNKDNKIIINDD